MSARGGASSRPSRLGRYELITQIGRGGMAEVQLALQRGPAGFEKLVVVKLVHAKLGSEKDFVEMLLDEARVAALVKHPNVVDIYDLGQADGRYFIAMEYLEGEPLLAVLRAGRDGVRLDPLSTARLISDAAEGLHAAHELRSMAGEPLGLVHHDVSLGNIVVLYSGQVKLVDFGVAKATQSVSTRTRVQGKFSYMAPEKLRGGAGDRRSDIWSLGCVLWESLTLKRLFKGASDSETLKQVLEARVPLPSEVNSEVLADFDPIVVKALTRNPDERYATAKELAVDLEEVLRQQGYGGKNDPIAKYMQGTFGDHIDARKKLLQEVSSKGRASTEILEAAFAEPDLGSRTPPHTGEFSVRFRPSGEIQVGAPPHRSGSVPILIDAGSQSLEVQPYTRKPPTTSGVRAPRPHRGVTRVLGAIALVLLGGAAVLVATRLSQPTAQPPDRPGDAPIAASDAAIPSLATPAPRDAVVATPSEFGDGGPPELGDPAGVDAGEQGAPPPPSKAAAFVDAGTAAYERGDTRAALAAFNRARAASPSYAPTWRGLGMLHEKLGDRGAAKAAFQRYLILSPKAADAEQIRARLASL